MLSTHRKIEAANQRFVIDFETLEIKHRRNGNTKKCQVNDRDGHHRIAFCLGQKRVSVSRAKLVLRKLGTFWDSEVMEIRHLDGDRSNDRPQNLSLVYREFEPEKENGQ